MKHTLLLILTLWILSANGQESINQYTYDSLKTGEWIYQDFLGRIKSKEYHEIRTKKISVQEAFNEKIDLRTDSLRRLSIITWKEIYDYSQDSGIYKITRFEQGERSVTYFGNYIEIKLLTPDATIIERTGSNKIIAIDIWKNENCKLVKIDRIASLNDTITYDIDSKDSIINYKSTLNVNSGFEEYKYYIKCESAESIYNVHAFGYDLSSEDFYNKEVISIKPEFSYYRTGNETLLKVFERKQSKPIIAIPIGQDRKVINLKELKNEYYWFCIVDYSSNTEHWIKAIIQ
jgi:hypothetical protein